MWRDRGILEGVSPACRSPSKDIIAPYLRLMPFKTKIPEITFRNEKAQKEDCKMKSKRESEYFSAESGRIYAINKKKH